MMTQYVNREIATLKLATPAHCKHWITEFCQERSYGRDYYWTLCKLCGLEFNHSSSDNW